MSSPARSARSKDSSGLTRPQRGQAGLDDLDRMDRLDRIRFLRRRREMLLQREARYRTLRSIGLSIAVMVLISLAVAIIDALWVRDVATYSGPILVRLGTPDGADIDKPTQEPPAGTEIPATDTSVGVVPTEATQPEETTPPETTAETLPETPPVTSQTTPVKPQTTPANPTNTTRPAATTPSQTTPATTTTKPATQPTTQTTPTSTSSQAASSTSTQTTPAQNAVIPVRGVESGNSGKRELNASEGQVGLLNRAVRPDIYMPVPKTIPAQYAERIQAWRDKRVENDDNFSFYYEENTLDGSYTLKVSPSAVEYVERTRIWGWLENDFRYDMQNAEYKFLNSAGARRSLSEVEILLDVSPTVGGKTAVRVKDVARSSGDPDIDAAIIAFLNNPIYFNRTEQYITGRFTYRFR